MYDVIIIGAGSGGIACTIFLQKIGLNILLVDKSDKNIGGDCLNFGCVPSKALIHVAKTIQATRDAQRFGLNVSGNVDMKKVQEYVDSKRETIRVHENADHFQKEGVDVALGEAKFIGPNAIVVDGQRYEGRRIILATGSRPRKLDIPGVNQVKNLHTNETIFEIKELPKKMVIIGGGPIGVELGQAFNRLGSYVTIVQRGPQFLKKEDPEIAQILKERLEKEGVNLLFNSTPKEFDLPHSLVVETNGKKQRLEFDVVLVSIGRVLNNDTLDVEKADIDVENRKIKVDEYMRTSNKKVLAVGDVAGSFQFTHAAEWHARLVMRNFFFPKKKINNDHMSWVTYTSPEIATFGLTPRELDERKKKYQILRMPFAADDRAIVDEGTDGLLKLYVHGNELLGGTMIAEHAGEICQELILANSSGLSIQKILDKLYPYPKASRINQNALREYEFRKLTKKVRGLLRLLFRLPKP